MKKLLSCILTAGVFVASISGMFAQSNSVELGLGGLSARTLNLRYERLITDKSSIQLTVSPLIPKTVQLEGFSLLGQEVVGEITDAKLEKGSLNGFSIIPEYRFYFGEQEGMRGFYVGPYMKYTNHGIRVDGDIYEESGAITPGAAKVRLSSFGVGLQIGAQWIISDHFTIDWHIIGMSADFYNLRTTMEADDPDYNILEFANDVLEEIELANDDFPIDLTDIASEISLNKFSFNIPFALAGIRAGISVGYAF